jgi:hypothetical protein
MIDCDLMDLDTPSANGENDEVNGRHATKNITVTEADNFHEPDILQGRHKYFGPKPNSIC